MKAIKALAVNGLIFLVLLVMLLAAAEAYLRLTIPGSSSESIFEWTLDNSRYKVMKKNTRLIAWGEELRTNDLGFRDDRDTVPAKGEDEYRVIVLGDSFTISGGVPFDKIYSSLLEQRLQRQYANSDVINLAVGGYNPVQYQAVLEEVGLGLDPDLILVGLFWNNDFDRGREATQDLNYRRAAHGVDMPEELSGFRALYVHRAWLWRLEAKYHAWFGDSEPSPAGKRDDSGWLDNLDALRQMAELARARDIPYVVGLLPPNWNYTDHRKRVRRVLDYCEAWQIECIDALEAFITSGLAEPEYRLNLLDSHPNARYHEVVADVLAPRLLDLQAIRRSDAD